MKKSIIIACTLLIAVSCNLLDKDDDNGNDNPPVPPAGAADVAVVELNAPETVIAGAVASIVATVENTSDEAVSETFLVILSNQTSEANLDTVEVEGLAANASTDVTLEWNTASATVGENTLVVSHNLDDDNAENNEATAVVEVTEGDGSLSDVSIAEVTAPDSAALGSMVDIEVMLENLGDSSITDDITLTLSDNATGEVIGSEVVSGAATGAQANVTFTWNTAGLTAGEHSLTVSHDFMDDNATNDSVEVVINLTEESTTSSVDLAISDVTAPASVTAGEDVMIDVIVSNAGEEAVSDDITVTLTDDAGNEIGSEVLNGVDAATDATVSFTWATEGVAAGDHDLIVAIDYADNDESNNEQTVTVTVEEAGGEASLNTDLDILSVETPENTVTDDVIYATRGDTVFVQVTVENSGAEDVSSDIPVVIYHHGNNQGSATIAGLAAGESTTVEILWLTQDQTTGAPPHPLDVTIDVADLDATNNVVTIHAQVDQPEE